MAPPGPHTQWTGRRSLSRSPQPRDWLLPKPPPHRLDSVSPNRHTCGVRAFFFRLSIFCLRGRLPTSVSKAFGRNKHYGQKTELTTLAEVSRDACQCHGNKYQGSLQRQGPSLHLAFSCCPLFSNLAHPIQALTTEQSPEAQAPTFYLLAPAYLVPHCLHLAHYSPGSLGLSCLCAFAISLSQRPFLLFIFLSNFSWVLPRQS